MYKITVIECDVNEWKQDDGRGKHCSYRTLDVSFEVDTLGRVDIAKAISKNLNINVHESWLKFNSGAYGTFAIVENNEGLQDEKHGNFIADYTFTIERTNPLLDLENIFQEI